ncbi:MAG: SDR family oxidoreductase, partial [Candidatus Omnitrophica bacterium]|nr:SDR family oxidoreductase [Candidatus Omnitrophota bacterium]
SVINKVTPQIIINCIGLIKQSLKNDNPLKSIELNALFPHKLAQVCDSNNIKLIHISTDCIFLGNKGYYNEDDASDVVDLYGKTKSLGEISYGNSLTIRTSMIGHELNSQRGLLEWFLSQEEGKVKGYTKAVFSGFTTLALCGILKDIIDNYSDLRGIYHISSEPIDKFNLVSLIKKVYKANIDIEPYNGFVCDRSLDSTRFRNITNFKPSLWEDMIIDMYNDSAVYNTLRRIEK